VGARFSAPLQTGPGAHPASCLKQSRAIPLLSLRAFVDHKKGETYLHNKYNQLDTHFTYTITLFRFKVSICFGHYLSVIRRHYRNAALVTIVCSAVVDVGLSQDLGTLHTIVTKACIRVVSPDDGQVMPETCRDFKPQ
jgi:hypothetical protein